MFQVSLNANKNEIELGPLSPYCCFQYMQNLQDASLEKAVVLVDSQTDSKWYNYLPSKVLMDLLLVSFMYIILGYLSYPTRNFI